MDNFTTADRHRRADAAGQYRHRHDHPQAVPEDDQALRPGHEPVRRDALHADGAEIPGFVLNKPAYRKAEIIVAGDNFGCGSSREHAPWALLDFGIRSVISTSFADIFYNNCFKNGILPIVLKPEEVAVLMKDAEKGANARIAVDLEAQTVTVGRWRGLPVRGRRLQEALPDQRAGRYRPDDGKGHGHRSTRSRARSRAARRPWVLTHFGPAARRLPSPQPALSPVPIAGDGRCFWHQSKLMQSRTS